MPQKQKLGIEKKVKIVKRYLAGEVSRQQRSAWVGKRFKVGSCSMKQKDSKPFCQTGKIIHTVRN